MPGLTPIELQPGRTVAAEFSRKRWKRRKTRMVLERENAVIAARPIFARDSDTNGKVGLLLRSDVCSVTKSEFNVESVESIGVGQKHS